MNPATTNHGFALNISTNLGTNFAASTTAFLTNYSQSGDLKLTRTSSSSSDDHFQTAILPNFAVNPANGDLYLVYHDSSSNGFDRANIYFTQSTNGGADWLVPPIKVNSDTTTNDQWQPGVTVKADGSKLFIAWYDRRNDASSNSLIQIYGMIASLPITGGDSFSTDFVISATNFPPVFTGTNTVDGTYDPTYPPAFASSDSRCCQSFHGYYAVHMGDYDTAVSDGDYFYYTWGDKRDKSTNATGVVRYDANIRFLRVTWPH